MSIVFCGKADGSGIAGETRGGHADSTACALWVVLPLGDVLKAHRTRCNMTQEFVAEKVGVSRQAVSKWEKGLSEPSTSNLIVLAKVFGVFVEELLKNVGSGEENH